MNAVKNKIFLWVVAAVWIMICGLWGCASKNVHMGSLKLKGRDYKKLLKKQMARSSFEAQTSNKLPKMTDEEYEKLGDTHFRQGNLEGAFIQYEKALRLNPDPPQISYKKGLILLAKGIIQEAIEEFQQVLKKSRIMRSLIRELVTHFSTWVALRMQKNIFSGH